MVADKAAASSFNVVVDGDGTVAMLRCSGRLVYALTDELLVPVKRLIPTCKRIVLDFTEVSRMDSSGLGTVVRLYVSARAAGCSLGLENIGPPIRQLLGVTNLLDALTIIGENNIKLG